MRRRMLDEVIEIAGTVDDPMNFNLLTTDDVEDKVSVNNQDTISVLTKSSMTRYAAQKWMMLKPPDSLIEFIRKRESSGRTILSNVIVDCKKVILRNRQITQSIPSRHVLGGGVSPSFVYG